MINISYSEKTEVKGQKTHRFLGFYKGTKVFIELSHTQKSITNDVEFYMGFNKITKIIYFSHSDKKWNIAEYKGNHLVFYEPTPEAVTNLNYIKDIMEYDI